MVAFAVIFKVVVAFAVIFNGFMSFGGMVRYSRLINVLRSSHLIPLLFQTLSSNYWK